MTDYSKFHPVDMAAYPRRVYFEHYFKMGCYYSVTVPVGVTALRAALKQRGMQTYPALIWALSAAANDTPEFRMSLDPRLPPERSTLGCWDVLSPVYTVMPKDKPTFSTLWTIYDADFSAFYRACTGDIARYATGGFLPQGGVPDNAVNISCVPWLDFTAFNLHVPRDYLLPILTIGRFSECGGKTVMPLAIQAHHAVCDGYHVGLFVERVRSLVEKPEAWL